MNLAFLYSLGVHIGNTKFILKDYYKPFLLGYRNNYCILDIRRVFFLLKKLNTFFFFLGKEKCKFLFYLHSSHYLSMYFNLFFFKSLNETRNFYFDERWSYGQLSNIYTTCYLLFTDIFSFKENYKNRKVLRLSARTSFYNFFYSLLFFTFNKKIPGMDWEFHMKRISKYWRFFLFFKFYRYLNRLPDVFLFFSLNSFPIPIVEARNLQIPVISNLDTDFNYFELTTYSLISNSQSLFIHFFYFISILQYYKKGININYKYFKETDEFNKSIFYYFNRLI